MPSKEEKAKKKRPKGYNLYGGAHTGNFEDCRPELQNDITLMAEELANGATRKEAIEWMMNQRQIGFHQASLYFPIALKRLALNDWDREATIQRNQARLERIIDSNIEKSPRTSVDALKELNKMAGATSDEKTVRFSQSKDTTEFEIKFGED